MDINIIRCIFIFNSAFTGCIGIALNYLEPYLSPVLVSIYYFGKFRKNVARDMIARCEVPKSWFKHFYFFAGPASIITLYLVFGKYLFNRDIPEIVFSILDSLLGTSRKSLVSATSTALAITLLSIQCWKRAYETHYVNIFSPQKLHISHYIIGFVHYVGALTCVIGESEGFVRGHYVSSFDFEFTTTQLVCATIFLWSSYMQFKINFILANLRKNAHGVVVTKDYKIPYGELFQYISNPLQFTEILMYIMLSVILWDASTYHYITIWVICNQVECAHLSHQWYHKTFKDYPKERNILIPGVW